jgi:cephalosporin-C deacetylase-like acetyl esterase
MIVFDGFLALGIQWMDSVVLPCTRFAANYSKETEEAMEIIWTFMDADSDDSVDLRIFNFNKKKRLSLATRFNLRKLRASIQRLF